MRLRAQIWERAGGDKEVIRKGCEGEHGSGISSNTGRLKATIGLEGQKKVEDTEKGEERWQATNNTTGKRNAHLNLIQ